MSNACSYYCIVVAAKRSLKGHYDFQSLPYLKPLAFDQNDRHMAHLASTDLDPHDVISDISLAKGQTCTYKTHK